ncbi:MAG: leucyl aminopeptidase [Candidatus Andersenbacteria bacterium]|nr:leucyl aminopeptidase [Candidatus Andersenbacteria bacterium]
MSVSILVTDKKSDLVSAQVNVVPVDGKRKIKAGLPKATADFLHASMVERGFKGEWGSGLLLLAKSRGSQYWSLVGLGDESDQAKRSEGMRRGLAQVIGDAKRYGLDTLSVDLREQEGAAGLAAAAAETARLVGYGFVEYSKSLRQKQAKQSVRKVIVLVKADVKKEAAGRVRETVNIMTGVDLARSLVNSPAEEMSPQKLAETAQQIAGNSKSKEVSVEIWDEKQAEKAGLSAFLAVGRGSEKPPRFIHLTYRPKEGAQKKVVLVGKGITFDSGGLSLKPAQYMEGMKMDMAGAAVVLGLFSVIEKLAPKVEVHGVIAACENMPSGKAYRPGDVLNTKNGKTIEVANTDAEGRITLADALAFAGDLKPDVIIDWATLAGACMVALGETVAGLFSNTDELADKILAAAGDTGEGMARLPMPEEYRMLLESSVADLRNISSSDYGGAITAAMFLREFVGDVAWAHVDIAGPAFFTHGRLPYYGVGATGYGVRTLARYLKRI